MADLSSIVGWREEELGEVATLQRGIDLPLQRRKAGPVPIFGSNGVVGRHDVTPFGGPGVITGRSGSIGSVYFSKDEYWPLNTTLYVSDFHGNDPRYVARLLASIRLERFTAATGVPSLNRNFVHPVKVKVPPLPEQRLIVQILDTVDEVIRKTEQLIAKLKLVKQGLVHDLLTYGIDKNGELRDAERHPEQFKDSPLGRIPREWEVAPLSDWTAFITDYRGRTPPYSKTGVAVISAENVSAGRIRAITKYVARDTYRQWTTRGFPEPGDVIFTTEAPVGEIARLPGDQIYLLTRRVIAFRPKPSLQKNFLYWYLLRLSNRGFWAKLIHGSTVPRMLKPDLLALEVPRPSLWEQQRTADILEALDSRLDGEVLRVRKLRLLKAGLMDDLLTGRVRVTPLLDSPTP